MTASFLFDIASVIVIGLTGALVDSRGPLDVVSFVFLAVLTASGGGTLRDVILDGSMFWVSEPLFILPVS